MFPHREPAARAGDLPDGYRYWAFISYSHADAAWARWVHSALETYPIPANLIGKKASVGVVPTRLRPIFRDRDELPAAAELGPQLEVALRDSVALVVLCSPHSAKSRWVNEEVLFFKRLGRGARVFPLIVGGVPGGGEGRECFPPGVRAMVNADGTVAPVELEPLAADAQPKKDGKLLALLKVIAGITGMPLDELRQREQQRRQRRLAILASAAFALTAIMTVLAFMAWQQRQAARRNERRAIASEDRAKQETVRATKAEKIARDEAERATQAETVAVQEREAARRALAESQMALAEAAYASVELPAMVQALDSVPVDLRTQRWDYLSARRDTSLADLNLPELGRITAVAALPGAPGRFATMAVGGGFAVVEAFSGQITARSDSGLKTGRLTIAVSPDGQRVAIAARGTPEIKLLRIADPATLQHVPSPARFTRRLVFSPDGQSLAVLEAPGVNDPTEIDARLWLIDLRDGSVRWSRPGSPVDAVFSPDARRLFTADRTRRNLVTLDAASGATLQTHGNHVQSLALGPDGRTLAVGYFNGDLELIASETGQVIRHARLHRGSIVRVAWTARDHLLTFGDEGSFDSGRRLLRLWETRDFGARGTFFGMKEGQADDDWDFDPQTGLLLTAGQPIRRWRIAADLEAARIPSNNEQGFTLLFANNTELIARKGAALARYDVSDPARPHETAIVAPTGFATVAAHGPAQLLAIAARTLPAARQLRLFSTAAVPPARRWEVIMDDQISRLDFDPAATRLLAVAVNRKPLHIVDVRTGKRLIELPPAERAIFDATGGRVLAIVPRRREPDDVIDELVAFDAATGRPLQSVRFNLRLNELVPSPDRTLLAIGGADKMVHVFDAATLAERWSFRAHDAEITALAFHPSLPRLLSAAADHSAKLWDYESGRLRGTLLGIDGTPVMAAFSPDGRLLALDGQERLLRLYRLDGTFDAVPETEASRPAGDWVDLLAALTPGEVEVRGNGWRFTAGDLSGPANTNAVLTVPGDGEISSCRLRFTMRRHSGATGLGFRLPWGPRLVSFEFDQRYDGMFQSVLGRPGGRIGRAVSGVALGQRVLDSAPHVLEFTFRLVGKRMAFWATLDGKPLCDWSGPLSAFGSDRPPDMPAGALQLVSRGAAWEISEIKLQRL